MAAAVVEIAEAVVDALNGATLSQAFTAVLDYTGVRELSCVAELEVVVAAAALSLERLSRRDHDFTYTVHVAVLKKIASGPMSRQQLAEACAPMMLLVQEILDLIRGPSGDGLVEDAAFDSAENAPIYDPDALDKWGVFASMVALNFKKARART